MKEPYRGQIKFGDVTLLQMLKSKKIKDFKKTKITIDFKKLMSIGLEKEVALNIIERLTKKNG
jgi:hypothetical protein